MNLYRVTVEIDLFVLAASTSAARTEYLAEKEPT